jgi:hypothetical protein
MCGYVSPEFDGSQCAYYDSDGDGRAPINRVPDADDVAGIQFLYGPPTSADFDGDDDVDGADFLSWQRGVGLAGSAGLSDGDADGDHDVDGGDLAIWQSQFGAASAAVGVPEPPLGGLLIAASAFVGALRGREHSSGISATALL